MTMHKKLMRAAISIPLVAVVGILLFATSTNTAPSSQNQSTLYIIEPGDVPAPVGDLLAKYPQINVVHNVVFREAYTTGTEVLMLELRAPIVEDTFRSIVIDFVNGRHLRLGFVSNSVVVTARSLTDTGSEIIISDQAVRTSYNDFDGSQRSWNVTLRYRYDRRSSTVTLSAR